MSTLQHIIEQVPSGEALQQLPEARTDLTPEEFQESFLIARLGSSAIGEHIGQLENILGHACMLGEAARQTMCREIALYRHARLVAPD